MKTKESLWKIQVMNTLKNVVTIFTCIYIFTLDFVLNKLNNRSREGSALHTLYVGIQQQHDFFDNAVVQKYCENCSSC